MSKNDMLADALRATLISPNVPDSNLEPAKHALKEPCRSQGQGF
jgi:hypothetical protein